MRLFIATPLTAEVERYLGKVINDLRPHGPGVKWVESKNIHVTLRFLGETDEALVPKLKALVSEVAAAHVPAVTELDRLGGFPNLNRPRVLWVGLAGGIEELSKMARQLELAARQLRFEPESKGFKAHLTLGRVRSDDKLGGLRPHIEGYPLEKMSMTLNRIVLFKSTLTPRGPIYDRLHEAKLGAAE